MLDDIKNEILEDLSPHIIYLFGSFAADQMTTDSDMDLAFLSDQEYGDYEVFVLAQKLADTAGRDVDLIQLRKASTVFQAQIVSTGKVLYCADEKVKDQYEMLALKKYAKLNEERKPILDRIKKEGTIYGE